MADELTPDECLTGKRKSKVETFIRVLDEVNLQLSSRFTQNNIAFMRKMVVFMPLNLLRDDGISAKADNIKEVCVQYGVDAEETARELTDFSKTYKLFNRDGMSDEQTSSEFGGKLRQQTQAEKENKSVFKDIESDITSADGSETEELDQNTVSNTPSSQHLVNNTFSKPLQLVSRLSGYKNLAMLYSIFSCLTVFSASAERALSKLKIVKNRLRSSLSDDMLSICLVLASEKNLLSILSNEEITQRLAQSTPSLRASLM